MRKIIAKSKKHKYVPVNTNARFVLTSGNVVRSPPEGLDSLQFLRREGVLSVEVDTEIEDGIWDMRNIRGRVGLGEFLSRHDGAGGQRLHD